MTHPFNSYIWTSWTSNLLSPSPTSWTDIDHLVCIVSSGLSDYRREQYTITYLAVSVSRVFRSFCKMWFLVNSCTYKDGQSKSMGNKGRTFSDIQSASWGKYLWSASALHTSVKAVTIRAAVRNNILIWNIRSIPGFQVQWCKVMQINANQCKSKQALSFLYKTNFRIISEVKWVFLPSLDQIFSISEKFPCTVFTDTNLIHSNVIEMINSTSVVLMQKRPIEITLMKVEFGGERGGGGNWETAK